MNELTKWQLKKIAEIIKKCEICNKRKTLQPHRIKRGCVGGTYTLRNIMFLCKSCHKDIHYKESGRAR